MDFPVRIPFVDELGFQLLRMADGEAELRCDLERRHLNSFGVAHGGLLMTLLDVSMAHAARATLPAEHIAKTGAVTIEMKTSFLRPGAGSQLHCVARVLHHTPTLAFCEARVLTVGNGDAALNDDARLAAHATGTFKFVRAVAAHGRDIRPFESRP